MTIQESYMHRCLELAKLGAGYVAPNPLVGSVLVHNNRIIGEGWHQRFGEAHAEVNCLNSVNAENRKFIPEATLYVSLEPCDHIGKTPACTDLILKNNIPDVVIGCRDPNKEVNGKGIRKLKATGVSVTESVLEKNCIEINKRFFTFHQKKRPYIILKWAQSANNKIAGNGTNRVFISNEKTNRLVHKWRSEEASILVGTNTALSDDPELTNRLWKGTSPVKLVLDMDLRLPETLKVFNKKQKTIIFNNRIHEENGNLVYYKIDKSKNLVHELVQSLYLLEIQSVLVEGGAMLLQSFIDEKLWDEIRVIKNEKLFIENGIAAPEISFADSAGELKIADDMVNTYIRN